MRSGLVGQHLQVEHQRDVLGELGGNARGLRQLRQVGTLPLLGPLDAPLDVAHALQVFVHLEAVGRPDFALEIGELPGHGVRIERSRSMRARRTDGSVLPLRRGASSLVRYPSNRWKPVHRIDCPVHGIDCESERNSTKRCLHVNGDDLDAEDPQGSEGLSRPARLA